MIFIYGILFMGAIASTIYLPLKGESLAQWQQNLITWF